MRRAIFGMVVGILCCFTPSATAAGKAVLIAGGGDAADGSPAVGAKLETPFGVDRDSQGRLLIIDYSGKLRAVTTDGRLITLCGQAKGDAGDGGPASAAKLNAPHSLAIGPADDIYIADTLNHRVRRIDARTGVITTFAGGAKGFAGDGGPAKDARFSGIYCIAFNPDQSKLVVTDLDNRRIRLIDMKSGIVSTAAGNGARGVPADNQPAAEQPLVDPRAAAMDSKGNIYLLERGGNALRMVDAAGKIHTLIAGPAKMQQRTLSGPKHLTIDRNDDVLIADTDDHRIVKWLVSQHKLEPIAGTGKAGKDGVGGPLDQMMLNLPHGVFMDKDGAPIISDSGNGRVLKIEP